MVELEELGIKVGKPVKQERTFELPSFRKKLSDMNDCADGDVFEGQPLLTKPRKSVYEDDETGEKSVRYFCMFYLADFLEDEYLEIRIPLKSDDDVQKNVFPNSKLFPLVKGVLQTLYPDEQLLDEDYALDECRLSSIRKMVSDIDKMAIKVKLITGTNGFPDYNSYVVIKPEEE